MDLYLKMSFMTNIILICFGYDEQIRSSIHSKPGHNPKSWFTTMPSDGDRWILSEE